MVRRLILGCGDIGERLAESLGAKPASVLGIDADRTVVDRLRNRGVPAKRGDPTKPATLDDLDPPETILVAGDQADENLSAATAARDRFPDARLVVYAGTDPTQTVLEQLRAVGDDVVEGARALADRVLEEGASPTAERARRLR